MRRQFKGDIPIFRAGYHSQREKLEGSDIIEHRTKENFKKKGVVNSV